jgi:hypothetical protein
MATFQVPPGTDKAAFQHTLDSEYRALDSKYRALELENVRLQGQLAGESRLVELERRRAEEHHSLTLQTINLVKALAPASGNPQPPQITNYFNNEPNRSMTGNHNEIHTGNGSFVNTGNFQPQGSAINLGSLSDQARISIEALSEARPAADQPSLRELLSELKRQIDNDPQLPDIAKADAHTEVPAGCSGPGSQRQRQPGPPFDQCPARSWRHCFPNHQARQRNHRPVKRRAEAAAPDRWVFPVK